MLPLLLSLLLCVAPLVAGLFAGRHLKARSPSLLLDAAVCVGAAATLLLPVPTLWPGLFDQLLVTALFLFGFLLAERPGRAKRVGRETIVPTIAVLLVAGVGAELVARRASTRPQNLAEADRIPLLMSRERRDQRCGLLFPGDRPNGAFGNDWNGLNETPRARRVLHVGDSMLNSFREAPFTQMLHAARPSESHLNISAGGAAPDAYAQLLHQWLRRLEPHEVYVHLFLENDLSDVPSYLCCDAGPLVTFSPDGTMSRRCETPRWGDTGAKRWRLGPLPYPLRVLARYSVAAGQLRDRLDTQLHAAKRLADIPGWGSDTRAARAEAFLKAIRDEAAAAQVPLTLVVLPGRSWLEGRDRDGAGQATHDDAVRAAQRLGIRTLDATPFFQGLVRAAPPDLWLNARTPSDPHFGNDGHRLYAQWLSEQMSAAQAR